MIHHGISRAPNLGSTPVERRRRPTLVLKTSDAECRRSSIEVPHPTSTRWTRCTPNGTSFSDACDRGPEVVVGNALRMAKSARAAYHQSTEPAKGPPSFRNPRVSAVTHDAEWSVKPARMFTIRPEEFRPSTVFLDRLRDGLAFRDARAPLQFRGAHVDEDAPRLVEADGALDRARGVGAEPRFPASTGELK